MTMDLRLKEALLMPPSRNLASLDKLAAALRAYRRAELRWEAAAKAYAEGTDPAQRDALDERRSEMDMAAHRVARAAERWLGPCP